MSTGTTNALPTATQTASVRDPGASANGLPASQLPDRAVSKEGSLSPLPAVSQWCSAHCTRRAADGSPQEFTREGKTQVLTDPLPFTRIVGTKRPQSRWTGDTHNLHQLRQIFMRRCRCGFACIQLGESTTTFRPEDGRGPLVATPVLLPKTISAAALHAVHISR